MHDANSIASAFIDIGLRDAQFKTEMAGFKKTAVGAMAAVGALAGAALARSSVKAFQESEDVNTRLAASIAVHGQKVTDLLPRYAELATELQHQTTLSDEQIMSLETLAVNFGINSDQIEKATKAAIGFSLAFGGDASSAMEAIGRALHGNSRGLRQYGIDVKEGADRHEVLNAALNVGSKLFLVEAAAAKTGSGQIKQAANAWDDFKESLGGFIMQHGGAAMLKFLTGLFDGMNDGGKATQAASDIMKDFSINLKSIIDDNEGVAESEKKKSDAIRQTSISMMSGAQSWQRLQEFALMHGEYTKPEPFERAVESPDLRAMLGRTHHPGKSRMAFPPRQIPTAGMFTMPRSETTPIMPSSMIWGNAPPSSATSGVIDKHPLPGKTVIVELGPNSLRAIKDSSGAFQ